MTNIPKEHAALYDTLKRSLSLQRVRDKDLEPIAQAIWKGLQNFPFAMAVQTINSIDTSSFPYPPSAGQILDIAKDLHGVSHEYLFWQGRNKFKELACLLHGGCDLVCDDWRVSFALRTVFGNINGFCNDLADDEWKCNAFATAYAKIDFLQGMMGEPVQLIESGDEWTDEHHVIFFGNREVCLAFLQSLPNFSDFTEYDPNSCIAGKSLPTQEELEQNAARLAQFLRDNPF